MDNNGHSPQWGRVSSRFWASVRILVGAFWCTGVSAHENTYTATIERWYDGDTPTVTIDLGLGYQLTGQSLRLLCVDTPEVRGETREQGKEVRDYVRQLLPEGTEVLVVLGDKGKFGRYLAVIEPKGWSESLNRHLLDLGMAEVEAYSDRDREACEGIG